MLPHDPYSFQDQARLPALPQKPPAYPNDWDFTQAQGFAVVEMVHTFRTKVSQGLHKLFSRV